MPEINVHLVLDGSTAKETFAALEAKKAEIETAIGFPLTWHCPNDSRVCRIYARKDYDFRDPRNWAQQQNWLLETLEKFNRVFFPLLKGLEESGLRAKTNLPTE